MFEAAKMIAAERVKNPGLLDMLRRWIENKYKLPWTHEAFKDFTAFEVLIDFWEDYYLKNPLDAKKDAQGNVVFQIGDPLIDKWEKELASGVFPDLLEGLSSEEREKEARILAAFEREKELEESLKEEDSIHDDYLKFMEEANAY